MLSLREWRRAKEISQEQMASKLGIHVNTYMRWENSPENISVKYARIIAHILNVEVADIIFCNETLQNVE